MPLNKNLTCFEHFRSKTLGKHPQGSQSFKNVHQEKTLTKIGR